MICQLGMSIYRTGFTTGMFIYPFLKKRLSHSNVEFITICTICFINYIAIGEKFVF